VFQLRGEHSQQTEIVNKFIEELFSVGKIRVIPIDERLSSVAAKLSLREQGVKTGHEKGRVDETAAAIILQEYLDSQS
jgi:putative Holliday junction resolvase